MINYGPIDGYEILSNNFIPESQIFLVDFDQCLSDSDKYDKYFGKLLQEKTEFSELLQKYNDFCLQDLEKPELEISLEGDCNII